ncbi:MAG: hypothetical protein FJ399_16600 [Verrucomicrobia bacterium]|nr:hypothetical protein [Verrucomicrobiota bacterium]
MPPTRPYLVAFLALFAIGTAVLAWRQYSELSALRASALSRDERAELQRRIWDLEKLNRQLQDRLAAAPSGGGDSRRATPAPPGDRPARDPAARGQPFDPRAREVALQQMTAMRELLARPDVQTLLNLQQVSGVEGRYGTLFKNLNLSPDQTERLKALLVERLSTRLDILSVALEQGLDPRDNPGAYRKLLVNSQNEINQNIRALIGDSAFDQLQSYEQTMPQRGLVNELQQRLSYTSSPLSAAQVEQLVHVLAANPPPRPPPSDRAPSGPPPTGAQVPRGPPGDGAPGTPGPRGPDAGSLVLSTLGGPAGSVVASIFEGVGRVGGPPLTPAALAQAQTVLAPAQFSALQQIQREQQAQQQLQQMVRDTLAPTLPPTQRGPAPEVSAGSAPGRSAPGRRPPGK